MSGRHFHDDPAGAKDPAPRRKPEGLAPEPLRRLDSATLFSGAHEIGIDHHGALYRLKITRQGKLILNK